MDEQGSSDDDGIDANDEINMPKPDMSPKSEIVVSINSQVAESEQVAIDPEAC